MTLGRLQVQLVNANGLEDSDFLSKMDPYVIITCGSQHQKSTVDSGGGSTPKWNNTFLFNISGDVDTLYLKIMDKDTFSADDLVGEAKIPLEVVFETGSVPPKCYEVIKDDEFKGEIRVGLTFVLEIPHFQA